MKAREFPMELHLVKHQLEGAVEQLSAIGALLEAGPEKDALLLAVMDAMRAKARVDALTAPRGPGGQKTLRLV